MLVTLLYLLSAYNSPVKSFQEVNEHFVLFIFTRVERQNLQ